jgi:nicotinamidase/pyrazinamidase
VAAQGFGVKCVHLLIIDPQNDFCDLPADYRRGETPSLPVAGAHADLLRVAGFIRDMGARLAQITVTLDSHYRLDIAHPGFWQTGDGGPVTPFTAITAAQLRAGDYRPRDPSAQDRAQHYLDQLEARGRYTLMVWPVHCEIGSWGHNVHADVRAAYDAWEEAQQRSVAKVMKGINPWTEHYSALLAEVPDPTDPHTQLNVALVDDLDRADLLIVAGEAGSHCVKATVEDVIAHLPGDGWKSAPERVVLLTDCMSPVTGFQAQHDAFLADMKARGVTLTTSDRLLQRLVADAA